MPLSGADQVMTRALVRVAGDLEGQEMKSAGRGSAARDREIAGTDKQRQAESRSSVMSETARMKKKNRERAGRTSDCKTAQRHVPPQQKSPGAQSEGVVFIS